MNKTKEYFIQKEFSKNALNYNRYNIIQKKVAKKLITYIKDKPSNIVDLGAGSGELYRLIDWEIKRFVAVDISENMCKLHPKDKGVSIINRNYEDKELFYKLAKEHFDIVISSSSLQWCRDLDSLVKNMREISDRCAVSIFCKGTFKTIYDMTNLKTFLPKYEDVVKIFKKYYNISYEKEFYRLYFEDNISKFRYIKKSGVSGGERKLGYIETKKLIKKYPLDYLEFEVLYIYT